MGRVRIAGYARISFDEELNRDNISIENQKSIITDYVHQNFPDASLTIYQDRDRSGYTFEQREGYQEMRPLLMNHTYDILVVKDFSRFSRRNSRGLVELEDLRDAGVRIISINDGIDFPSCDDWTAIQFRFLINEMPVVDTSKKIKAIIRNKEAKGEWLCRVPYGYIIKNKTKIVVVPEEAAVIQLIYKLYIDGLGYKKIAEYLTEQHFPTYRMNEKDRVEETGRKAKRTDIRSRWHEATIRNILANDFYIGTLRQNKLSRVKINGKAKINPVDEQYVFENHHEAIIDERTYRLVQQLKEDRYGNTYRGFTITPHVYSGLLVCSDCGNHLVGHHKKALRNSYQCGLYTRFGTKACTTHYIRGDSLDNAVKLFLRKVMDNCQDMVAQLDKELTSETSAKKTVHDDSLVSLERKVEELSSELKATKRQRIKDIARHPEQEDELNEIYEEMESELLLKISGTQKQITMLRDKKETAQQAKKSVSVAMELFNRILEKEKLERCDLEILIKKIVVFEDHVEIYLHPDIDDLLKSGMSGESGGIKGDKGENFKRGTNVCKRDYIWHVCFKAVRGRISVYVVSNGSPLDASLTLMDRFCFAIVKFCKRVGI